MMSHAAFLWLLCVNKPWLTHYVRFACDDAHQDVRLMLRHKAAVRLASKV